MRFYLRSLAYFREDLPLILASFIFIGFSTFAAVLQPYLLKIMVDTIIIGNKTSDWETRVFLWFASTLGFGTTRLGLIKALACAALLLRVGQELLSMGQRLLNVYIGYNGLMRARCDLFRKLQELSLSYYRSQPQGDAIYRLSYDTCGFQTILNVLVGIVVSSVTLVWMTYIMLQFNWQLTLITLSVAPLLVYVTKVFAGPMKRRWIEAKEVDTEMTTVVQRSVAAMGLVQAFGREADEYERFQSSARNSVRANFRQSWQESIYWMLVGVIFGLGYALIFGYGGWLVYRDQFVRNLGEQGFTIGSLTLFLAYVLNVYGPLQAISGSGTTVQGGVAGAQRVFDVLDRDPVIRDAPDAIRLPLQPRTLELQKVGFEYREGEPVLRDVDVKVQPGQMVAFVGSSGVGKTTLLNLLPRFYDPTSGQLTLDGIDIRTVKVKDLRKHVALVLQESAILPTTVAENIAYGRPDAHTAAIHHAAEISGAAAFIDKLPDKYQTVINESGGNLSGGQRQRISIARALLTEAPIIVLDEPTSALDAQNESMIIQTLLSLKGKRTIIIVSHRLSTVFDCDQIFVMDEGRIVERGTHAELLAMHGVYFEMARHQLKIEDSAPAATGPVTT